ncbi:DUF881 domain-containing protein [Candidatus Peregrinibacteria bacterium]|nr:DUF881 domain-containing protein [Candidatus Peregrinibacteria bacterium]
MKTRFFNLFFIFIGIIIGIILSLQIRAQPVGTGSSPEKQLAIQKSLLNSFLTEQESLKKKLLSIEEKLSSAKEIMEKRSSRETQKTLSRLKRLTGFDAVSEEGIRITLSDNPSVSRVDFSALNENFVQASDLRDLVNVLFLQDAKAISINEKRILPFTSIQPVFDSILVGNFQIGSPFVISVVGNPDALQEAVKVLHKRKIQIFVDTPQTITVASADNPRSLKFLSLDNQ